MRHAWFSIAGIRFAPPPATRRAFGVLAVSLSLAFGLISGQVVARPDLMPFEATFAGTFSVAGDVGRSVLFAVHKSGTGSTQASAAFSYTASVLQNPARTPPDCGPSSSTGVDGFAVLSFADGELTLKRIAGTSCFAFPHTTVEEQWLVGSGRGAYAGATGALWRRMAGDVRFGTASGSLSGALRSAR